MFWYGDVTWLLGLRVGTRTGARLLGQFFEIQKFRTCDRHASRLVVSSGLQHRQMPGFAYPAIISEISRKVLHNSRGILRGYSALSDRKVRSAPQWQWSMAIYHDARRCLPRTINCNRVTHSHTERFSTGVTAKNMPINLHE